MNSMSAARLLIAIALAVTATLAVAAEIHVLSAAAVKGPLTATAAAFERETGNRVVFEFTTAGRVDARIAGGERPDLIVNTRARLDALAAKGGRAGAVRDLGTVRVGVAVRNGLPKPDVSTVEAFRAALVAARSVAYTDPAAGGTAGSHFAAVIEKLGLTEELAGKRHLAARRPRRDAQGQKRRSRSRHHAGQRDPAASTARHTRGRLPKPCRC